MIGPTIRQGREAKQQDKAGRQSVQEQSKKATAFSSSATKMNMNDLSGSAKRFPSSSSSAGRNQATAQRQPSCSHQRLIVALFCVLSVAIWLLSVSSVECHIKRTQYHEQGLHGPKSYKFGFTAGDHKNPQQRHEVSDGHGHVKGWYSFVDANGKHQVVHYEADPKYGFKVFNHKEKAYNNGKRHYNS